MRLVTPRSRTRPAMSESSSADSSESPSPPPGAPTDGPCLEQPDGRVYPFAGRDRVAVGRSKRAEVSVADPRCSRRHCELVRTTGGWLLAPLSLANPTRLNGRPVTDPVRVADGDRIEVGDTVLVFRDGTTASAFIRDSSA